MALAVNIKIINPAHPSCYDYAIMTSRKYARVCCASSAGHDANHALKGTLKQNQFFSNHIFELYYENCSDFILVSGFVCLC